MLHGRQAFRAKIRNMAPTAETDVADLKSFVAVATKYSNDFHDPETRGARSRFLARRCLRPSRLAVLRA